MSESEDTFEATAEQEPFVMLPLWLLGAGPSAVKLYAILKRYSNNRTHQAWPSRALLAQDMGFKQAKTLDPIIKELEAAGAVRVARSARGSRKAVNVYHLATSKAWKVVAPENGPLPVDPENGPPLVGRSSDISRPVQRHLVDPENGHELRTMNYNQGTKEKHAADAAQTEPPSPPAIFEATAETVETRTAQTLIAEWIDHCDPKPPQRVLGQTAREVKNLLAEGISYEATRDGLIETHRKGLHPSTLASVVHSLQQRPTSAMQPSGNNTGPAPLATGTQRAMDALAAGQRLQAQYDQNQLALGGNEIGFSGNRHALGPGSTGGQPEDGRRDDSGVVGNPQPFVFR